MADFNPNPYRGEASIPHVSEEFFKVYFIGAQVLSCLLFFWSSQALLTCVRLHTAAGAGLPADARQDPGQRDQAPPIQVRLFGWFFPAVL